MGQQGKKGQGVQLKVIEGKRNELERLLVEDLFRPNSEPSQLDALAQRLRTRAVLRQVVNDCDEELGGAPSNNVD